MSESVEADSVGEAEIRTAFAAFAEGDAGPFFKLLDDEVVVEFPASTGLPWAGRLVGKDAVARAMAGIAELGRYEDFALIEIFSRGSDHMVLMRETFRFAATGEAVNLEQVFLYETSAGKVVSIREWTDTARIRDAYARASAATVPTTQS